MLITLLYQQQLCGASRIKWLYSKSTMFNCTSERETTRYEFAKLVAFYQLYRSRDFVYWQSWLQMGMLGIIHRYL